MKKITTTYYKVEMGGSMYQEYEFKDDALKGAIKHSIGKEVGKDFIPIYRIKTTRVYDEKMMGEMLIKEQTAKTLAMIVSARKSSDGVGGWIDYEQ